MTTYNPIDQNPATVLVVDDHSAARNAVCEILTEPATTLHHVPTVPKRSSELVSSRLT